MENNAFSNCSSLKGMFFLGPPPTVVEQGRYSGTFQELPEDAIAYVNPEIEGWPAEGEKWNGFTIQHFDPEDPPELPEPEEEQDEDEEYDEPIDPDAPSIFDDQEFVERIDEINQEYPVDWEPMD